MILSPHTCYVFGDGSSSQGAHGPDKTPYKNGGWGVVLHWNGHVKYAAGGGPDETNNTMELTALLEGMRMVKDRKRHTIICSDSQYALKAMFEWATGWEKNGWKTSVGAEVKNRPLVEALLAEKRLFAALGFQWVRGHTGVKYNEEADVLAGKARLHFAEQSGHMAHEEIKTLGWL